MTTLDRIHVRVAAPSNVPRPYGLFSVVPPLGPADTDRGANSAHLVGVQWESWACVTPFTTFDGCINGGQPGDLEWLTACPEYPSFKPVTVYIGIVRDGQSLDTAESQARSVLAQGEEFTVEGELWAALNAAAAPDAAMSPKGALAVVEKRLGVGYMGRGVIHMDAATATELGAELVRNGSRLETPLGTPVVVGAGYGHGAQTIFGTGALDLRRGPVNSHVVWDKSINDEYVLADRTYVVGWDCFTTGVLVTPAT